MRVFKWISGWLGYLFCEAAFRLDEWVDLPPINFDSPNPLDNRSDWKRHHHVIYPVFSGFYSIGCWFYDHDEGPAK